MVKYLSYSQYNLFKNDPGEYYRRYVLGQKWEGNKYTEFGKKLAEALEFGKLTYDMGIEHIRLYLPNFVKREFRIEVDCMGVPILGVLDGFEPKQFEIDEVKTGKKWDQKRVDADLQITWYSLLRYLKYKKQGIIRLHWAKTIEDGQGIVKATGELQTFITRRNLEQQMQLANEIKRAWKEIKLLWKNKNAKSAEV